MRHITLVKKIKKDGTPCRKCIDVMDRLAKQDLLDKIDRIVIADERNLESEGMLLAARHNVKQAPFFIVEDEQGSHIYTVYFRFVKEALAQHVSKWHENLEILDQNSELDFI